MRGSITRHAGGSFGLLKVSGAKQSGEPTGEPTTTDTRPRPATDLAGRCHAGPRRAMSRDRTTSSYKRGVAGSSPAAPTTKYQLRGGGMAVSASVKIV